MLPDAAEIEATIERERALGWTIGSALYGITALAIGRLLGLPNGYGPGGLLDAGAVPLFIAFGVLGWTASHRGGGLESRLAWLAVLGAAFSIPGAMIVGDGLGAVTALAAGAGALLAVLGWSLEGRLIELGASLEDADIGQGYSAAWLVAVASATATLGFVAAAVPLVYIAVIVAIFAAARWVLARDRLTSRRRWLRDVRDGASPKWSIQPRGGFEPMASTLAPLVRLYPLDGVLVPRADSAPYRQTPMAVVPLVRGRPRRPVWSGAAALRPGLAWVVALAGPIVFSATLWPRVFWPGVAGWAAAFVSCAAGSIALGYAAYGLEGRRSPRIVVAYVASLTVSLAICAALYLPWD